MGVILSVVPASMCWHHFSPVHDPHLRDAMRRIFSSARHTQRNYMIFKDELLIRASYTPPTSSLRHTDGKVAF